MVAHEREDELMDGRAISAAEAVAIVDDYIRRFREALDDGRVRADGASDFNTMMRLKAFLEGKADSRQEVHGMITLEDMQARHRALRAQLEALDPAVTGEVPPRERDRTRGLLADHEDGSARRLRRASREERASFPDVVYSGRPGRGWDDEPEQTEPGLRKPGRGWR